MAHVFKSKAETLAEIETIITTATILPQLRFTVEQWLEHGTTLLENPIESWLKNPTIVRSSAISEDTETESKAGHYCSVTNVNGFENLVDAVKTVIASFVEKNPNDQVFIQPMLQNVKVSGVVFTRDPNNGAPYDVVNYDDFSGQTDSVTSGQSNNLHTFYHSKHSNTKLNKWKNKLFEMTRELESFFNNDSLDIEFAVDQNDILHLLQIRPLIIPKAALISDNNQKLALQQIEHKIKSILKPHPYLLGERTVLGIMPDWNPAEIIGVRPRPLALSLYKELITDNIWAYQRDNYGYRNLRSFPLLINLKGLPYIDVRVSFNSFIPADLPDDVASKLVSYYLNQLCAHPNHHDKVEFEIVFSCYSLDIENRLTQLNKKGEFSKNECSMIAESLRNLTNAIIRNDTGLWKKDISKIKELKLRQKKVLDSELNKIEKIYWLMEDCKRYGTLPFAGLARAGFIAVQLLKSMVTVKVITSEEYERFMNSLDTVNYQMNADRKILNRTGFLSKYGFLRPGTYDIRSPRYDEAPDDYFNWDSIESIREDNDSFALGLDALNSIERLMEHHKLDLDVLSLFNFIKGAIEGREYAKFIFTKSLSDAIKLFIQLGHDLGFSTSDLSFADINIIKQLYASAEDPEKLLKKSIDEGKENYKITQSVNLPPLISSAEEIHSFELPVNDPNFITQNSFAGSVIKQDLKNSKLKAKIIMIPSADPGFDWLFTHDIGGLITKYGGINSHMAIRAGELGIPSVIGCGELLYKKWEQENRLLLDCANKQVKILK